MYMRWSGTSKFRVRMPGIVGVHDNPAHQTIRQGHRALIGRREQPPIPPLTRQHDRDARRPRNGDSEDRRRDIERVDQGRSIAPEPTPERPRDGDRPRMRERADRQRNDRHFGPAEIVPALATRVEAPDHRIEQPPPVECGGDLVELRLGAAKSERSRRQHDAPG